MIKNVLDLNWVIRPDACSSNLVGCYFLSILIVDELFIQTKMIKNVLIYIKQREE